MKSSNIGVLAALVGGAALGTFFGVLYAPDKGRNTRGRLNYRLHRTRDRLKVIIASLDRDKEVFAKDAQEQGNKVISEVSERAEDLLTEVEALITQIRSQG